MTPLLFIVHLATSVSAQQLVHRIITATDPSVDYEPIGSPLWLPSTSCTGPAMCVQVPKSATFNGTGIYMNGTYILPTLDPDDFSSSSAPAKRGWRRRKRSKGSGGGGGGGGHGGDDASATPAASSTPQSSATPAAPQQPVPVPASPTQQQQQQQQPAATGSKAQPDSLLNPSSVQTTSNPNFTNGPDSDDGNFVGDTMLVRFNFFGQSAQLFGIIPSLLPNNATISVTNLTFLLDGQPSGTPALHNPTDHGSDFQLKAIYSVDKLEDTNHTLTVVLAPSSVFLVGYLNYTSFNTDPILGQTTTTTTAFDNNLPAATSGSPPVSKHNIATFAGAVAGSVGVFTIVAFVLWMSIWHRRRKSRRRLRAIEEEEANNARRFGLDPDEVLGPIPFIPRYFPGTVPPSPPPYEPGASEDGHATTTDSSAVSETPILAPIPRRIIIPPPETSQLQTTPPVSIAAASIMNRSLTSSDIRPSSILNEEPEDSLFEATPQPPLPPPGLPQETPLMRSRPPSRHRQSRREDDMSDTENGGLLRASSTADDTTTDDVPYRDESPNR